MALQDHTTTESEPATGRARFRGSNQLGMRAHNERLVLSLIRSRGPMAKAELARISGLSAQTVSVIMRALEAEGLLIKGVPVRGKVGQPSVPMGLNPDGAYFLGLKIGRRSVELVLTDFLGDVIFRTMQTHDYPKPATTLQFAREEIDALIYQLTPDEEKRLAGLGIAMPFFLWDWAQTLNVPEAEMAGWREVDIRADLAALYDFPVFLENDATAACGAEVVFGRSAELRDFLYFYVGYFIGGGVVLNGALFSGRGNAGAMGPLPVPAADGSVQQLIDVASLVVLENRLKAAGAETECIWESAEGWQIDTDILLDWIDTAAAGIAHAIVSACSIIDFRAVMIDGWLPIKIRNKLVVEVERKLDEQNLTGLARPVVWNGSVGADARVLGAASLPLSERFLLEANAFGNVS